MLMHACIPAPGTWRQEDGEFEVNLGYIVRPCLPKKKVCVCVAEAVESLLCK
jgi:hypothetical protein